MLQYFMKEAVIFDMDGILVDSEPLKAESWEEVLKKYGIEGGGKWYTIRIGTPGKEIAREAVKVFSLSVSAEDIFREENKKLFEYFSSLSPDLKERFKLIWLRKRPEQHYLIIDRKSMVFESKHKEGEPREIYCVLENKKEAEKFLVFYNQLIKAKGEYLFVNSGNKQ